MPYFRTLVVDDFDDFRKFLCSTLKQDTECKVVGEASDGLRAVLYAQQLQPDLILLDIGLPTLNGIEAARRIRKLSPNSKILFFTQYCSRELAQGALRTDANGYLLKSHATDLVCGRNCFEWRAVRQQPRQGRLDHLVTRGGS
jgi:DNA-binding NarL/FixJ family response regulator